MPTGLATELSGGAVRSFRDNMCVAAVVAALTAVSACTGSEQGTPGATAAAPQGEATAAEVEGTVHVCSSCHGLGGRSVSPTFPRLAGQRAEYIEVQLKAFRDHTRADPHAHTYMWGMAAHLSDPLIHGLAMYFAKQPRAEGTPGNPQETAAGKTIYLEGLPDRDVAPCQGCHGEHGEGIETIPAVIGQHRDYLIEQLENFLSSARENEIMHENTKGMTAEEIRQVSAFLAAQ